MQLLQIGFVGLAGALAIGITSWYAQNTYKEALDVSERNATALRNHMEGDMMHDALRGDVQRALCVANEKNITEMESVRQDIKLHSKKFRDLVDANKKIKLSDDARQVLNNIDTPLNHYIDAAEQHIAMAFKDLNAERAQLASFNEVFSDLEEKMADASDKLAANAAADAAQANTDVSKAKWIQGIVILISGAMSILLAFRTSNQVMIQLGGEPATAVVAAKRMGKGDYEVNSDLAGAERDSLLGQLETMRIELQASAAVAIENARIKQALESTSSNVMMADNNRNIVYMNKSVVAMLRDAEADLRKALPHFSVDKALGSNMDIFHKNPSHQSNLLANLRETYVGNIVVAGRSFRLIANPIFSQTGERLGSVVEPYYGGNCLRNYQYYDCRH
jgi:hypothetical protein